MNVIVFITQEIFLVANSVKLMKMPRLTKKHCYVTNIGCVRSNDIVLIIYWSYKITLLKNNAMFDLRKQIYLFSLREINYGMSHYW